MNPHRAARARGSAYRKRARARGPMLMDELMPEMKPREGGRNVGEGGHGDPPVQGSLGEAMAKEPNRHPAGNRPFNGAAGLASQNR